MLEEIEEIEMKARNLLEEKKIADLRVLLNKLEPADVAILLNEFESNDMIIAFRILSKELAAETFVEMDTDAQETLIHAFSDNELKQVLDELFLDDTVDIIEEMPANVVKRILKHTDSKTRKDINEILKYPKDCAGSIMTTEYVDLKQNMTVQEAIERIRKTGIDKETINSCYVTDRNRKLIGILSIRTLLLAESNQVIKDIMETNVVFVETIEDKEEVAKDLQKYDFLALPVVDKEKRLVGIVTFDDAMDVITEENTEDFELMSAITPIEDSYFKTSVFKHAKNRIVWLLFLMLSATVTGAIITNYENAFAAIPVLVSFIPMLMGTGGNCGSQSSTMIIRGLALEEIKLKDIFKVIWKEIRIALIVGIILSLVNGLRIYFMYEHDVMLALAVGLTLICTVVLAKLLGCILPLLAKICKLDPAIMAAPLITTIVDTCSVLIFFNIAMWVLNI